MQRLEARVIFKESTAGIAKRNEIGCQRIFLCVESSAVEKSANS